jgi:DNA modification methylase
LQLDVIDRVNVLWSNPGEIMLTPFMGVGSEVYGAVCLGRRGIGMELKPSYYRQAVKNIRVAAAGDHDRRDQIGLEFGAEEWPEGVEAAE